MRILGVRRQSRRPAIVDARAVAVATALLGFLVASTLVAQTLKVPDAAQFVGAPSAAPLTGEKLYRETNRLSGLLRCPVCQGLSVADSPSEMAVNMKEQVRELLARGYSEEQILKYFELSYGQFVLLQPKFEGFNSLVWLLPIGALAIGAAIVFAMIRKLQAEPTGNSQPPTANLVDDEYLSRVRNLVNGDK